MLSNPDELLSVGEFTVGLLCSVVAVDVMMMGLDGSLVGGRTSSTSGNSYFFAFDASTVVPQNFIRHPRNFPVSFA